MRKNRRDFPLLLIQTALVEKGLAEYDKTSFGYPAPVTIAGYDLPRVRFVGEKRTHNCIYLRDEYRVR